MARQRSSRAGLAKVTRALVRHDLAQGLPRAARARLADLETPDDALRAEVNRAIAGAEEQERRDAALRTELDQRTGRAGRIRLALLIGSLWTLQPIAQHLGVFGPGAETHLAGGLMAVATVGVFAFFALVLRAQIGRSRLNRQLVAVTLLVLVVQVLAYAGAAVLGLTPSTTQTLLLFVWFCISGVLGVTLDARLLVPAAAFLVAFGVAAEVPAESGSSRRPPRTQRSPGRLSSRGAPGPRAEQSWGRAASSDNSGALTCADRHSRRTP